MARTKAEIQAWHQQLVTDAEQKIMALVDTDKFQTYLQTMARFHHYSSRNIGLIYAQDPQATQIAGYRQWQHNFKRQVQPGAKAVRIAAPIVKTLTPAEKQRLKTKQDKGIVGYRYLPVFDIKQTSGDPVASSHDFIQATLKPHGSVTQLYNAFKAYLNEQTSLSVTEVPLQTQGLRGYFEPDNNRIVINSQELDSGMRLKTLYHEYAHSQLHGLTGEFKKRPRAYQEAQAESVAYVVMQNVGIDTQDYSLGYVAVWAQDKKVIYQALSEIQKVSHKAIDISDQLTKQLSLQRQQQREQTIAVPTEMLTR